MIVTDSIEIAAPADVVWQVYSDVERWPEWTRSVSSVRLLEGAPLAVGSVAEIRQPKLPKLRWTVTELAPPRSWAWTSVSPGSRAVGRHEVTALGPSRARADLSIEQAGPLGALVGRLIVGLTRRYLAMEAAGLKSASEARAGRDGRSI